MKGDMDKSLFFLLLSFACIWLVLDVAVGGDRLGGFLQSLFPSLYDGSSGSVGMTVEEVEEAKNNAPSSSAIGSGKTQTAVDQSSPLEILKKKASGQKVDTSESAFNDWRNSTGVNTVPYAAIMQGVQ